MEKKKKKKRGIRMKKTLREFKNDLLECFLVRNQAKVKNFRIF